MNRRLVIKQILIMAGGMAILPSCLRDAGKSSIQLSQIDVSLDQEQLLAEIAETLIPKTNSPGAKDLNLHLFVLKMLDDCHAPEAQQSFLKGLAVLDKRAEDEYAQHFKQLPKAQRQEFLLRVEAEQEAREKGKQVDQDLATFYRIMKSRTISGYMNSKYVMTQVIKWELVPGRYNGYYPVKSA